MTTSVVPLVPPAELDVIETYLTGADPTFLEPLFDDMQIPADVYVPRLRVAVAQILLNGLQGRLPQWGTVSSDGGVILGRHAFQRALEGPQARLEPELVCCINWADSGPGYSWPEAYHVTYIPGFEKYIVTASRDSTDSWGCTDQAIGFCDAGCALEDAAHDIITGYWREMFDKYDQGQWAYLFDEGLIDEDEAERWAEEVWGSDEIDNDDE
jgi:hypothetical protein